MRRPSRRFRCPKLPASIQPHLPTMEDQPEWFIDEHTRRVGRVGLAAAQAALENAARDAERGG